LAGSEPKPCLWGNSTPGVKTYLAGFNLATGPEERDSNAQKSTNLRDDYGGMSEEEELVHAGNENSPHEADGPSTEGS